MKLKKSDLHKLIVKEFKNVIDEEALLDPSTIGTSGTGKINIHIKPDHDHKGASYMAKPQLEKISEYAGKLHDMVCNGEQLDDWIESHIAQMADDISEVYHAMEYKKRNHHK